MKVLYMLLLVPGLLAYQIYQEKIPNGARVPHPCKANFVWQGVGHMNKNGGGMRNRFGEDFAKNGHVWDRCLCETDSDEDGRSNGEELGDPDCEWVPGAQPKITALSKISHPGICDPHDSEECRRVNNWEFCEQAEFVCDPLKEQDVKEFTLTFTKTKVPAAETTYMCQMFDLPDVDDYHIIGNQPALDNANVMHHAVVRSCTGEQAASFAGAYDSAAPCGMDLEPCSGPVPGWTVGLDGDCLPETYGYRLGKKTGHTKAIVQFHWNNPEGVTDYEDGSGLKFYYTEKLREFDVSLAVTGPIDLHIPPKQRSYVTTGVCSSECGESLLNGTTRYIVQAMPHMHYMGRGLVVEHWRGEERLEDLLNTNSYSYDNPVVYNHEPPVEYRPGDKLITRCIYNSMNQEQRTFFGDSTQDEMCLAYLSMYPGPFIRCFGGEEEGSSCLNGADYIGPEGDCNMQQYFESAFRDHFVALSVACDPKGLTCLPECLVVLEEVNQHPCMQDDYRSIIRFRASSNKEMGVPFLHLISSCDHYEEAEVEEGPPASPGELCPDEGGPASHAPPTRAVSAALLLMAVVGLIRL